MLLWSSKPYIAPYISTFWTIECLCRISMIFKSGIPIGTLKIIKENSSTEFSVEFYSDFSQLKYVFAEITTTFEIPDQTETE